MDITLSSGMVFGVVCFVSMLLSIFTTAFSFKKADQVDTFNKTCKREEEKPISGWFTMGISFAIVALSSFVGTINVATKLFEKLEF